MQKTAAGLLALALMLPLGASAADFRDTLDTPARENRLAARSLLNGLAVAGPRLVAVGQRGHILVSDDAGKSWRQAKVPVSSDLVAVHFPNAKSGWAVGHDGVVLHSADGGETWTRQLDGKTLGKTLTAYYEAEAAAGRLGPADEAAALLGEFGRMAAQGAENSLLDVWFTDDRHGFVVGAFNLILRTTDGGKSWEPWLHRTDNPNRLHLYAVRQIDGAIYAAGEQGLLLKLDAAGKRFVAADTGYRGTFFGLAGSDGALIAYGLRGNAYRSTDAGKSWRKVDTGLADGITAAAGCGPRRLALVSQSGRLLLSDDAGEHFRQVKLAQPAPASAVLCTGGDGVVIAGARGVQAQTFKQ